MRTRIQWLVLALAACSGPGPVGGAGGASPQGGSGGRVVGEAGAGGLEQGAGGSAGSGAGGAEQAAGGSAGGGALGSGGSTGGANDFPCEVAQVLSECKACHGANAAAGLPHLVTRADLEMPSDIDSSMTVGERSVFRMRLNGAARMPPAPNAVIARARIDAFDTWVIGGMPAAQCNPAGTGGVGGSGSGGMGGSGAGGSTGGVDGGSFVAEAPYSYGAKVKNVLVGLPLTNDELNALTANPAQLRSLVDGWMTLPQYKEKMARFFQLAFQQTQISGVDFQDILGVPAVLNLTTTPRLVQNLQDSFALTMLNLTEANQPFTRSVTTNTYAMTTALQALYALRDVFHFANDRRARTDTFRTQNPSLMISIRSAGGAIPLDQTLNPASPNFMKWYDPSVMQACGADPFVFQAQANDLFQLLVGGGRVSFCPGRLRGQLLEADYTNWKMVTVRPPRAGEATTKFYDLAAFRDAARTELVLERPAVGFFTTPAFFANWMTNDSNQMRVTLNQALIVTTGTQVDGSDPTVPTSTPGLDSNHSNVAACSYCHRTLDPTRSILSSTFSWNYGTQKDTALVNQKGLFAYRGVQAPVTKVQDLATSLAGHPLFKTAWPQKLCFWVNSQACDENDPEFIRIAELFRTSNWSWKTLVKEIVTSPLTTHTQNTLTNQTQGSAMAVARRDHLCAAWNARLGFADLCAQDTGAVTPLSLVGRRIIPGLPSDGYSRGATEPLLPNDPTLFHRAGMENLCTQIANLVVDATNPAAGSKQWSSAQSTTAIAEFVSLVAGLPAADPRAAGLSTQLTNHFNAARMMSGVSPTFALRSTFILACMSPSATAIGL
jgi:hypothetical protein